MVDDVVLTRGMRGPSSGLHPVPRYGIDVLLRDRLFEAVAAAGVTEVVAPAGYGKTTLLASWAASTDRVVAWVTLTGADADPVHFVGHLTAALKAATGSHLEALATLPLETDLNEVIAALHDRLASYGQPAALVVDDVHAVSTARSTLQLLDDFVSGAPEQLRVVLVGRQAAALRTQRWRLQGRLASIQQDDLAFTRQETSAVMKMARPDLDPAGVTAVHDATGGWPAAVRMSTLAAAAGTELAESGAVPEVTERLVTALLEGLDSELRAFVLDASVDDRVCARLLDEVRGSADSAQLLARCYHQGLFLTLVPHADSDDAWYDWHDLFVVQVRKVATKADPARCMVLQGRSASWWRTVDAVVAVRHALRADRPELAAETFAETWPDLALTGRTQTVAQLISELPQGSRHEADVRLAAAFVAAAHGDTAQARSELRHAHATAKRLAESERAHFDARGAALSLLYLATDSESLEYAVVHGRELLRRLEEGPWTPDPVSLTLIRLCLGMGEARVQRDNARALKLLQSAGTMAHEQGLTGVHLVARAEQCMPLIATNALDVAAAVADEVLSDAAAMGWGTPRGLAPAVAFQGWLSYWTGDLVAARRGLSHALALFHSSDSAELALTLYFRALTNLHTGDLTATVADVEALRTLQDRSRMPSYWESIMSALDAEVSLAGGDLAAARRLAGARAPGRQYRLAVTSRARVLLRLGSPGEAVAVLEQVDRRERFVQVEALIERIRAEALWAKGHHDEAYQALDRALEHAAPFRLLLPFLIDGRELKPLLAGFHERWTAHEDLLAQVMNAIDGDRSAALPWGEQLSSRELSVLTYLQTSLTLPEIAAAEQVSVNTVKTHVASIYRKLGVKGRREAVHAATRLEIL